MPSRHRRAQKAARRPIGYSQAVEQFRDAIAIHRARESLRDHDVVAHTQVLDQVRRLEENTNRPSTDLRSLGLGSTRQNFACNPDQPAVGVVEPGKARQERRLAGTARSYDGNQLAGVDVEGHATQRKGLVVTCVVEAVQIGRDKCGGHCDHANESVTVRHGSTLSAPCGDKSVIVTSVPARQNSYTSTS